MKTRIIDLATIRQTAEHYYSSGDFYCSEAIVKTIRDVFCPGLPDEVIAMASGFPIGMGGAGCTCGAISGGIMVIGMLFGRTEKKDERVNKAMELSRELHDFFQRKHKTLCCRVLTQDVALGSPEQMRQCVTFTGEVAEEVARIIARELEF